MSRTKLYDDKNYVKIPVTRITLSAFFISLLAVTLAGQWFFSNYHFQSPVVVTFQFPIKAYEPKTVQANELEERYFHSPIPLTPTPTKAPKEQTKVDEVNPDDKTKAQIIKNSKYPDRLAQIHFNETTNGKPSSDPTALHMYCRSKGMTNEFGFMPHHKHCFKTFQESVDRVALWFDKEAKNLPLAVALCWYSGHGQVSRCNYDKSLINL